MKNENTPRMAKVSASRMAQNTQDGVDFDVGKELYFGLFFLL